MLELEIASAEDDLLLINIELETATDEQAGELLRMKNILLDFLTKANARLNRA